MCMLASTVYGPWSKYSILITTSNSVSSWKMSLLNQKNLHGFPSFPSTHPSNNLITSQNKKINKRANSGHSQQQWWCKNLQPAMYWPIAGLPPLCFAIVLWPWTRTWPWYPLWKFTWTLWCLLWCWWHQSLVMHSDQHPLNNILSQCHFF